MIFIETSVFTQAVEVLLDDDAYALLQQHLTEFPEAGDLLKNTGGLRKIRWSSGGKGKRSGVRVIYYHLSSDFQIRMLLIYRKGIQDKLTPRQAALLRKINEEWQ
ncbi:type II toxin-antitoxin system RelE/ParE family toxin [Arenimonas daejeonensis]|uniref:type II toxin-antitoxin system RelE/ParE family toxin n=1 Tax=Arenimonas daejeonensis TaxID=370777 RepID=UPI0011BD8BDF|nr:type II toxin-antitoxin system RelE/ParE family toxin [Arenimonas daejeonensis]